MILGYHAIFSTYGFWLPNDPRGSWSDFVGNPKLLGFGHATKTQSRSSVAHEKHNNMMRQDAKLAMKCSAVVFDGIQARSVGQGFAEYINKSRTLVWACAILPDHVHLTIGQGASQIEYIVNQLKGYATRHLLADNIHPFQCASPTAPGGRPRSCWARGQWTVYLNNADDIRRSIQYVEDNPCKQELPRQRWSFVRRFEIGE